MLPTRRCDLPAMSKPGDAITTPLSPLLYQTGKEVRFRVRVRVRVRVRDARATPCGMPIERKRRGGRGSARGLARRRRSRLCHPSSSRAQVSVTEKNNIGMVVIRGNSIVMIEALERLAD
jgi:hypothetical protein